ncbi:hypothetical protein AYL99_01348 [Fonsecaea erecta]|uniref:Zn(2)-C6 fungal-type domain-containing protein n=1 Tax=Fonsecaea erecta TaxID=1367422 RepID=A0A179A1F5_9EURO|nr:hypothetical protein AYL99_01348 [Fonsecaea erecta]OAP65376.1 hypothetical protein AYL99_01348 [Fonsecaea erecta]
MKSLKPAPKPGGNAKTTSKPRRRTSRGRTSRALKKAKCDGDQPCKLCRATESECAYSARRREARNYYYQMREVTDLALQQLYWASRRRTGFPGDIPDESKGEVSTTEILKGLGLWRPCLDEFNFPGEVVDPSRHTFKNSNNNNDNTGGGVQRHLEAMDPCHELEDIDKQSATSTASTSSSPRTSHGRVFTTSNNTTDNSTNTPLNPDVHAQAEEMDMQRQFELASSLSPLPGGLRGLHGEGPPPVSRDDHQAFFPEHVIEPSQLDVDAFIDMSLCTSPVPLPPPQPASHFYDHSMSFSMPTIPTSLAPQFPYGQTHHHHHHQHPHPHHHHQPSRDHMFDGYLTASPGTTTTVVPAHRPVATG